MDRVQRINVFSTCCVYINDVLKITVERLEFLSFLRNESKTHRVNHRRIEKRRQNRERNIKREFLVVTWKLINNEREKRSILFVRKIGNSCHVTIVSRGKAMRTRVKSQEIILEKEIYPVLGLNPYINAKK